MPGVQRQCEKGLREWRRAFLSIKFGRSKVEAVNRLCRFALEMRAYWPDTTLPGNGELPVKQAEPYTLPSPVQPDAVMLPPTQGPAFEPEKLVDFPGVVHVTVKEAPAPVEFSGVLEGAGAPVFPKPTPVRAPEFDEPWAPAPAPAKPDVVEIFVHSVCPNPRLLSGRLPDGKPVAVWKGPHTWRLPCKKFCRKDTTSPNYTPV